MPATYTHTHSYVFDHFLLNRADLVTAIQKGQDVEVRFRVEDLPTGTLSRFVEPAEPLWKRKFDPKKYRDLKLSTCISGDMVMYIEDDHGKPWPITAEGSELFQLSWEARLKNDQDWDDDGIPKYGRVHPFFEIGAHIAMPVHSTCTCAYCAFVQENVEHILLASVMDPYASCSLETLFNSMIRQATSIRSHPLFDKNDQGSIQHLEMVEKWVADRQARISAISG